MRHIKNLREIAKELAGGKHLVLHPSVNESREIGEQLTANAELWPGLKIETFMPGHRPAYVGDDRISVATVMPGGLLRNDLNDNRVTPSRESLYEQAMAYEQCRRLADILVLQVSPPDENGHVSLGPSVGIIPQVLAQDPFVIGVINKHVPRTNFTIPENRLNAVLTCHQLLPAYEVGHPDPIDQKIASLVASQLDSGITVEIGIGGTTDAVMAALSDLEDLHIHTGLINDAIIPVVEAGGMRQPVTTTMAVGSQDFYQWLDENDRIQFRPVSETHNVKNISALSRFYAINTALQIDLQGNVNAERIGTRLVSLPGGLPDFAAAAKNSKDGCNIIVMRSTAGRQHKSTIVREVDHITLEGALVDMVVTERGIADLRGLNRRARGDAIAAIASNQEL